ERGDHLAKLLPGDRWLKLYVDVYRACLHVASGVTSEHDVMVTEAAITEALATSRASDFRMETLALIYQARFETARGDLAAAGGGALPGAGVAAAAARARATDPLRANPFDEILARRALADLEDEGEALAELSRALRLAERTRNVLQDGIVRLGLADRLWASDPPPAGGPLPPPGAPVPRARRAPLRRRGGGARRGPARPPAARD